MARLVALGATLLIVAGAAAAQTAPPVPSVEAEALGRKIATLGTFSALFPILSDRDVAAMIADHPELDAAGKARLRAAAAATKRVVIDQVMTTIGHQYATRLSFADLTALAAFADSPAAAHWRAAEPQVIVATVPTLDGLDFKKSVWDAYCRMPESVCAKPK